MIEASDGNRPPSAGLVQLLELPAFVAALDHPEPGISDKDSWAKWNEHYGRNPVPLLPTRRIPGVGTVAVANSSPTILGFYKITTTSRQTASDQFSPSLSLATR